MTEKDLGELLKFPEASWLDWKQAFPAGLRGGKQNPDWDKGRGELLKDLVAIANGRDDRELGYLVYGVRDNVTNRTITGVQALWDDAMFQVWVENTFDPLPIFSYSPVSTTPGTVGIFTIKRTANYPHVAVANLGGILFEGQVWFRRGTKNTIAHAEELRSMFTGEQPVHFSSQHHEPLETLIRETYTEEWEPVLPEVFEKTARTKMGYEVVYFPGTRQEIWIGPKGQEQILMRRKRKT